jgi:hypothetical protein
MKGSGLLLALGKPKPGGDEPPGDGAESIKMNAAEDLIAAQKSGDAKGVADAFKRMYDACAMGGGYEDED